MRLLALLWFWSLRGGELPAIVTGCRDRLEVCAGRVCTSRWGQDQLVRSEIEARNFFAETRWLYETDRERWKASAPLSKIGAS